MRRRYDIRREDMATAEERRYVVARHAEGTSNARVAAGVATRFRRSISPSAVASILAAAGVKGRASPAAPRPVRPPTIDVDERTDGRSLAEFLRDVRGVFEGG